MIFLILRLKHSLLSIQILLPKKLIINFTNIENQIDLDSIDAQYFQKTQQKI